MDVTKDHPPVADEDGEIRASSGRAISEITMEALKSGALAPEDLRIDAQTLLRQAGIARGAGLPQLAANLMRAAELTAVPNETLLEMYNMLRPGRSSMEELMTLAAVLEEQYNAAENARFIREAAEVYRARDLLRRPQK